MPSSFSAGFWTRPRPTTAVTAQGGTYVHQDKTKGERQLHRDPRIRRAAKSDSSRIPGHAPEAWTIALRCSGRRAAPTGNLPHGENALPTFSEVGFGYAVEKAPTTMEWTYPLREKLVELRIPQEMAHFARCVRGKVSPIATGEDGRFVQQVLFAAYQSMGAGQRVHMLFDAYGVKETDRSLVQSGSVSEQRGDDLPPFFVQRDAAHGLRRAVIPIRGVAFVRAFLAMQKRVHPRACGVLDLLRRIVRGVPVAPAIEPQRATRATHPPEHSRRGASP